MICGSEGLSSGFVGSMGCFSVSVFLGSGCCSLSGFSVAGVDVSGTCVMIVMPLTVRSEPIHTMIPKKIEWMPAAIMEGSDALSVRTISTEAMIERL